MSRYLSTHVTGCMTRQDLQSLMRRMSDDHAGGVRCVRSMADTVLGRMICEWESPDHEQLLQFMARYNVRLRDSNEWVMQVQMQFDCYR